MYIYIEYRIKQLQRRVSFLNAIIIAQIIEVTQAAAERTKYFTMIFCYTNITIYRGVICVILRIINV